MRGPPEAKSRGVFYYKEPKLGDSSSSNLLVEKHARKTFDLKRHSAFCSSHHTDPLLVHRCRPANKMCECLGSTSWPITKTAGPAQNFAKQASKSLLRMISRRIHDCSRTLDHRTEAELISFYARIESRTWVFVFGFVNSPDIF